MSDALIKFAADAIGHHLFEQRHGEQQRRDRSHAVVRERLQAHLDTAFSTKFEPLTEEVMADLIRYKISAGRVTGDGLSERIDPADLFIDPYPR